MAFLNIKRISEKFREQQQAEQQAKEDFQKQVKQGLGLDAVQSKTQTATQPAKSNTKKYLIIGGGVVVILIASYFIFRKLKK